jgi:hypothetical protein
LWLIGSSNGQPKTGLSAAINPLPAFGPTFIAQRELWHSSPSTTQCKSGSCWTRIQARISHFDHLIIVGARNQQQRKNTTSRKEFSCIYNCLLTSTIDTEIRILLMLHQCMELYSCTRSKLLMYKLGFSPSLHPSRIDAITVIAPRRDPL